MKIFSSIDWNSDTQKALSIAYEASPHSLVVMLTNAAITLSDRFNFSSILSSLIAVTTMAILNAFLLSSDPKSRLNFLKIEDAFAQTIPVRSYAPLSCYTVSTYAIPTIAHYAVDANIDIYVPARVLLRRAVNEINDDERKVCAILFASTYSWSI